MFSIISVLFVSGKVFEMLMIIKYILYLSIKKLYSPIYLLKLSLYSAKLKTKATS